jgi:hypothetical protein
MPKLKHDQLKFGRHAEIHHYGRVVVGHEFGRGFGNDDNGWR